MTAEHEDEEVEDDVADDGGGDDKKKKRSKPRRQSGTAVAFQKRASVRKLPERTTSSHLVERKGKNQLEALTGGPKQDRRGSQGAIKAATSAMRAARGVPGKRGVSRASSSQNAPRRPDRAVAPAKKKTPARSSSSHALKPVKRDGAEPTITGADLLNLRKAKAADDGDNDCDSVQSDLESTYTMDSINLRKSQIHHDDDLAQQLMDAGLDDDDLDGEQSDSVSTLQSEDGAMTDFEALADVDVEDEAQGEAFAVQD